MGSFSLPIWKKIIFLILFPTFVYAKKIEGISLSETLDCGGKTLPLQSYGIRKATIFGIKVYVLAYYGEKPIKREDTSTSLTQRPICLDIHYLRDFDDEDVDKAWEYQFKESSTHPYPDLKKDLESIKLFFGEIKGKRKQSFKLANNNTLILENDSFKGSIQGENFQKNFLFIFFGEKPPTKDLKEELFNNTH
jgi:hypothetical protein